MSLVDSFQVIHQESSLCKFSVALLAVVVVVTLDVLVQLESCGELMLTLRTFVFLPLSLARRLLRGINSRRLLDWLSNT